MPPRILFIGGSGNIGSAVLEALVAKYPEVSIDTLVRSEQDGSTLKTLFPSNVVPVIGVLEDLSLLEEKASEVSIVINCAPDVPYGKGIASILTGLSTSPTSPKFLIHTSGAARIWDAPDGFTPGRVWDDIADFDLLPDSATHSETDTQVFSAAAPTLHTAIVAPGFVVGRSPSRTHAAPITFPYLLKAVRDIGGGFVCGEGKNVTAFVDTAVLAEVYVALVADALRVIEGGEAHGEVWGPRAYYFVSSLELSFWEFVEDHLLPALKRCGGEGLLNNGDSIKEIPQKEITDLVIGSLGGVEALWSRHIAEGFGTAMRIRSSRAKKYLGIDTDKGLPTLDDAVRATLHDL